jgi:hypothetical protein
MTPALDPLRNVIYVATGNPAPDFDASVRPGDNLYTDSIVALDARTGRMRWYYQETPHDAWDYDAASPAFLFDIRDRSGSPRAAVGEAGKSGWLYVLDRDSGALLRVSEPLVPMRHPYGRRPGGTINPGGPGGALGPASYDPLRALAFLAEVDRPDEWYPEPAGARVPGKQWKGGSIRILHYSLNSLVAVDPTNGRVVWRRHLSGGPGERFNLGFMSGSLSAGDLVFVGEPNGVFFALRARDGAVLWRYDFNSETQPVAESEQTAWQRFAGFVRSLFHSKPRPQLSEPTIARIDAPPIRYIAGGREFIALCVDIAANGVEQNTVIAFALSR